MTGFLGTIIVAVSMIVLGAIKMFWPSYPDDNVIEEVYEEILKDKTGIDIDLTPRSKEVDKK